MAASSNFERALVAASPDDLVQAEIRFVSWWLPERPQQRLLAIAARAACGTWRWTITDAIDRGRAILAEAPGTAAERLAGLAGRFGLPMLPVDGPLPLQSVTVAKPWGFEHWYSGIEARGIAGVGAPAPGLPLPWVLSALPTRYGGILAPQLVKVLDPHPDPVLGDLYFETHDTKEELYLVTHVDRQAWPDGGCVRLGFDPARIATHGDTALRQGFAAAVSRYRPVRQRIDALLSARKAEAGLADSAVLEPGLHRRWLAEIPAPLRDAEARLRAGVLDWTHLERVLPGDVIRVPPGMPHALQHGVRVLEVQTPTYERRILFFGQQVLTPGDWDTEAACRAMLLDPPTVSAETSTTTAESGVIAENLGHLGGSHRDRAVHVLRIRFEQAGRYPVPPSTYAMVIGIEGTLTCGDLAMETAQAALLPGAPPEDIVLAAGAPATCLLILGN